MEDLKAKLDLIGLSEKEREKAEQKFIVTLSLISYEDLKEINRYLKEQGVFITKAKDIKVYTNPIVEIKKKFSILDEIHEVDIYRQDPSKINLNVLDIYKKVKYCIQIGKSYKKADGSYEESLFSEFEWQKVFNRESSTVDFIEADKNDEIITVQPTTSEIVAEPKIIDYLSDTELINPSFERVKDAELLDPMANHMVTGDEEKTTNIIDIGDYMVSPQNSVTNKMANDELDMGSFDKIRKELEGLQGQLAELDSVGTLDEDISFNDILTEDYNIDEPSRGHGGRAA